MTLLILIFAALTCLAGLVMILNPKWIFDSLQKHSDKPVVQLLAVVVRLLLGVCLIVQSPSSKFPLTIEIIGWLSIAAAICFAAIGRQYFIKLMNWAFSLVDKLGRLTGIVAAAFGIFLVYAFL